MLIGLIRLARPQDWIKNVFVLAPLPFAMAVGRQFEAVPFLLGLFGFCLINSAIYTLNDWCDAASDRMHPKKCERPLANGTVSSHAAVLQMFLLALIGMAMVVGSGKPHTAAIAMLYVVFNVAYNLGAKHVALLDVFLLSSGFVIRVLLGCSLVSAPPSVWLLLCTTSLALFLGFAKRRADLKQGVDHRHRPSLRGYSMAFLDQAITICAGTAILSYALYGIEAKVLLPGREMASMPFVAYAILNYLRIADVENGGGSPVEVAYHSRSTQVCVLGWIVAVTWSLGLW
jgi:4-hydroxybenzoate polyprenyltransferase